MDVLLLALLVPGLLFIIFTTLILLHNRRHFFGLGEFHPDVSDIPSLLKTAPPPLVSILVPARNEENNLPRLLETLQQQDWPRLEIHILDDHSDDGTRAIAEGFCKKVNSGAGFSKSIDDRMSVSTIQVFVHEAGERPDGWLGKNWACHQLSLQARGDLLIFLDADTWLASDAVSSIVTAVEVFKLDFATVWPHQVMKSISEKAVVSTVYATIDTYLPTLYSYRAPAWIPFPRLRNKFKPLFASACGQCMIFTRKAYQESGGHEVVKDQVVEDVMLARNIVRAGKTMRMFHGTGRLWCRMYRTRSELFNGFRKNFFAGFGYRILPFLLVWLLHFVTFVFPVIILVTALLCFSCLPIHPFAAGGYAALVAATLMQRLYVAKHFEWPLSTAFLYLPGVLWFHMLAVVVLTDHLLQTGPTWKGRPV
jgi:chlorobactene glucosyltransferase